MSVVLAVPSISPNAVGLLDGSALVQADQEKVLPVGDGLAALFPHGGLRRGSTVVARGSITVLLALLAEATEQGSWAAVVGMPELGLLAAAELGVAIERVAVVPKPGAEFGAVVAALLDGMDIVAVEPGPALAPQLARRLSARARNRGSVIVSCAPWPAADLELICGAATWDGLGPGHGHLTTCALPVQARGRGAAARPVRRNLTVNAGVIAESAPPRVTFPSKPLHAVASLTEAAG